MTLFVCLLLPGACITHHVQQANNDSNLPHPIQVHFARDVTICLVGGRGARRHDEEKFDGEDQRAWSKWWVTFASPLWQGLISVHLQIAPICALPRPIKLMLPENH